MSSKGRQELYIIGAGGHGNELCSYIRDLQAGGETLNLAGFIDDYKPRGNWGGSEVLGGVDLLRTKVKNNPDAGTLYITAVGNNQTRRGFVQKVERLGLVGLRAWTLRHPHAIVGYDVQIGEGTCLAPGSILTTNVRIGRHCIINVKVSVSHDSTVGDFTNINPGAVIAGNVQIGRGCYIGAGATVIEKITIGDWAVIGAGAVVINDIPPGATAVGVPARVIKRSAEKV